MLTWVKKLLWDETVFLRAVRALLLFAASAWNYWSIEGSLTQQGIIGSVVAAGAVFLGAGDRNPKVLSEAETTP